MDDEHICQMCQGTGIGVGDPDTSKCVLCRGRGWIKQEEDLGDRADREYDEWRDRQIERD